MNHPQKTYSALICMAALGASPVFAQQSWNPVSSDTMNNTAMGTGALTNPDLDADGACHNTASGADTLAQDTSGSYNTATGFGSLTSNLTGDNNTGLGAETLYSNTSGSSNTASGYQALYYNTTGSSNTASGSGALYSNANGNYNTASGYQALYSNTSGGYTTAVGAYALQASTTGGYNTGFGAYTLNVNTSGSNNTAFGYAALRSTTSGNDNIGFGYQALYQDASGSSNIAMGYQAAYNVTSGSNTIEIGSAGEAGDNHLIRIGTQGVQTQAYLAGVAGNTLTGSAVYVTSSGELGVQGSSERYKEGIEPMGRSTEGLAKLRPVSFRYKNDPSGTPQYGLIAEEVAKVYPELVVRGADGRINGIHYEELAPMLLNEVQQQRAQMLAMQEKVAHLDELLATLETRSDQVAMR